MTDESDHDLETDPESWASPDPSESPETIVDPEELAIAERDEVRQREDGRYVVSTDGTAIDPDVPERTSDANRDGNTDPLAALASELADASTRHAVAVAVRDGEETTTLRVGSADRADALAAALRAYARTVEPDRPPADTLREILAESGLDLTE